MPEEPIDPTDDPDLRRVADLLIRTFGSYAPLYALHSVDLLIERGDFKTAARWRLISRAAEERLAAHG